MGSTHILGKVYFEMKTLKRQYAKFRNQVYLLAKHKCPHCGQSLYGEEAVELHHIKPRKEGGKWSLDNIVLFHETKAARYKMNINLVPKAVEYGVGT